MESVSKNYPWKIIYTYRSISVFGGSVRYK